MSKTKLCLFVVALVVAGWVAAPASSKAQRGAARQVYGARWFHYPKQNYYLRYYFYKPHAGYNGYNYQYIIYRPATPGYVYYYNPHKRKYWGRYDVERQLYSVLPPEKRKDSAAKIAEADFPPGGPMPPMPESKDGVTLAPPPQTPASQVSSR